MAGPRDRDRHAAPPSAVRRRRQGTRGPPPLPPPPLPLRPKSGRRQTEETAAPQPPRRGRCTRGAGAPRPRQAPARPARCRPTADGRRPGRRKRSGPIRGRPGEDGGANQGGGFPPPSPPPPTRRTDPLAADRTAPDARGRPATRTARVYPGGGTPETTDGRPTPHGAGERGGGPASPPPPPPPRSPPPAWKPQERPSAPPEPRGRPPSPRRDRDAGGGGCGWTCTPRAPAPPAACSRGGRGRRASPHQRAGATRAPSLGAAHGGVPEQYGGRAPHDPPVTTAHSGRAEGGFRSAGAPGGAVHAPPLIPPHPGVAPRPRPHAHDGGECANGKRGARMGYQAGCHPEGEQGGRGATPRPHPPRRPASRGGPGPQAPRQGGWSPPPRPGEELERDRPPRPSRRLPQEPRRTSEPAPTRQDAAQIAPSEGGRARTGVVWGAEPPMDRTTPVTPALLPAQGRQRDGTRQSDPPPYRPPPAAQTGGTAHAPPPPPPACPPAHERQGPAPRSAAPTGRADQGDREGPPQPHARAHSTWIADPNSPPSGREVGGGGAPDPRRPSQQWKAPPPGTPFRHPHNPKPSRGEPGPDRPPPSTPDGARERGRTRGGARTTWNGPTSAQCRDCARCARHTTQEEGERTPRERERTHTQRARGDYQKGNRTEDAERTDRVEWRTSERG